MSTVRKIAKNTSLMLIWNIATKVIGLLISIYIARYLGVTGYGNYSFIMTYALFFGIFIEMGISTVVVREISKNGERTEELIANSIGIKLTLFVFVFLTAFSIISLSGYPSEIKTGVLIALISLVFTSLFSLLSTIFQADLKMQYPAFADLTSRLVLLGAVIFISYQKGGLLSMVFASLMASIICFLLLSAFSLGRIRLRVGFNNEVWREIGRPAALLGLSGVFATVIIRMDTILISLIKGNIQVGYYAPPSQLTDAITFIPASFMTSLLPLMSAYSKTSKQALEKSFRLAIRYMLALAIPMAFGTTLLSDRIITAIYGVQFLPSASALVIMTWCDVLIFSVIVIENLLVSIDKQKNIFIATAITATFNVLLNLALIPPLGFVGASIALILSYVILVTIYVYLVPNLSGVFDAVFITKSVLASFLMALFIKYLTLPIYIIVIVAALLYFILLFALGGISSEDIDLLKKIRVKT
jgi:O-antigen/teichoic acid export membrane protein